ncbi:unnamed protein product [Leuciscus chuanchicus]
MPPHHKPGKQRQRSSFNQQMITQRECVQQHNPVQNRTARAPKSASLLQLRRRALIGRLHALSYPHTHTYTQGKERGESKRDVKRVYAEPLKTEGQEEALSAHNITEGIRNRAVALWKESQGGARGTDHGASGQSGTKQASVDLESRLRARVVQEGETRQASRNLYRVLAEG